MLRFILIILTLSLVGCTAVQSVKLARTQTILVDTPHAEGAKCVLTDARGREWRVRKTPASVAVEDGHSPLQIVCKKKGYKTTIETVNEQKEELLTIDGKRVTAGIYDQFPTKMPRLIPSAVKEVSSFVLDPTGNISTKYPSEVTIWMEPEKWNSKDEMIAWAYDREIDGNEDYIEEDNARIQDEQRKEIRRAKKLAREQKREEMVDKGVALTKKALDVETYVDLTKTGVAYGFGKAAKVSKGAVDTSTIAIMGSGQVAQSVAEGFSDMSDEIDINQRMKWLEQKSKEYGVPWNENSNWKHSNKSKLDKSGWVPNWLNLRHSNVSKVGGESETNYSTESEEQIIDVEKIKSVEDDDVPPWIDGK